ncbi:neuralized-like protein 4 [Babylonia areolata]|uniref:neuralized-like protein 4 n=1 Tax=Babylonia areolata TaxID=304850 RepID=UPI003FCFFC6D
MVEEGLRTVEVDMAPGLLQGYLMEVVCLLSCSDVSVSIHPNTGVNIVLSNDRQTAERRGKGSNGGIVVSIQPMKPHLLYEVHLDERGAYNRNYMRVGATTVDPGSMTLPTNAGGWTSAVVFSETNVEDHGVRTNTNVGQKLPDLPKGSRVGVMLDDRQRLHLYINGEHQGEAGTTVSQPCFAFFDVFGPYRKITALPLRVV